jgi:hypothetical protein
MNLLIFIAVLVFILNIPFGYWRANVKRFSKQWFLAIHIPVPGIILLRLLSGIGFEWFTYVFLVGAFFLGQQLGSVLVKSIHRNCQRESSCMVMDLIRCSRA